MSIADFHDRRPRTSPTHRRTRRACFFAVQGHLFDQRPGHVRAPRQPLKIGLHLRPLQEVDTRIRRPVEDRYQVRIRDRKLAEQELPHRRPLDVIFNSPRIHAHYGIPRARLHGIGYPSACAIPRNYTDCPPRPRADRGHASRILRVSTMNSSSAMDAGTSSTRSSRVTADYSRCSRRPIG